MALLAERPDTLHAGPDDSVGKTLPGYSFPIRRSTIEMIRTCFRHQHPEELGACLADNTAVPAHLRYGAGDISPAGATVPEEPMVNPGAVAI
jgi:hypothetical protein